MTESKKKAKKKRIKVFVFVSAGALSVLLLIGSIASGIYYWQFENPFWRIMTRTLPFPALYVQGAGVITIHEMRDNRDAVEKFYTSQDYGKLGMRVDFGTDQGKKRLALKEKEILNKMVENIILEDLLRDNGIILANSEIEKTLVDSIKEYGDMENLSAELAHLYGWSLDDFKDQVVRPQMLVEKLSPVFKNETDSEEKRIKINEILGKIKSSNRDFSELAAEYSEGKSKENGGELGWSSRKELIEEIADKAFSMKPKTTSEIIESPLGFHIIYLEEKKTENGDELVHLRQIFVKKKNFGEWLDEKMKTYKVHIFLKQYEWNSGEGLVVFRDPEMLKFEKEILQNSAGDPSVN